MDVVNNKYDLFIDMFDCLVIIVIVSNVIDVISGGKVKVLIIVYGYLIVSSIVGVVNCLIGEKIYQVMDMLMEVVFNDVSCVVVDYF